MARAIHAYSPRARKPFVAVNQAALPPTLIESELFGHERGAFTGATARRSGRFEAAAGGTLFLDEIGDLDPALQSKLLRVVQEGTYERVGGNEPIAGDVRLIAATNRPVRPGAAGATLREELYYRLAVIEIELPPLRVRRSDIPLLVAHALRGKKARAVSEAAMQRLLGNPWPGNVRELFHVLERAAVLCASEVIDVGDLPDALHAQAPAAALPADDDDLSLHGAVARRGEAAHPARARSGERKSLRGGAPARHRPPSALREDGGARARRTAQRRYRMTPTAAADCPDRKPAASAERTDR